MRKLFSFQTLPVRLICEFSYIIYLVGFDSFLLVFFFINHNFKLFLMDWLNLSILFILSSIQLNYQTVNYFASTSFFSLSVLRCVSIIVLLLIVSPSPSIYRPTNVHCWKIKVLQQVLLSPSHNITNVVLNQSMYTLFYYNNVLYRVHCCLVDSI